MLNAVAAPAGVDEAKVRRRLLEEFDIEIGAGLGAFKGKAWRIGLMGESATERHVTGVLAAFESVLAGKGMVKEKDGALAAARSVYKA
jgi:alanine-glyoxylate transaminase/serine-glyoxylate transaminase/serine-pyruvate transaminase